MLQQRRAGMPALFHWWRPVQHRQTKAARLKVQTEVAILMVQTEVAILMVQTEVAILMASATMNTMKTFFMTSTGMRCARRAP